MERTEGAFGILQNNKILKGDKVYIRQPYFSEIRYIQLLWGDKATMEAVGGPIELTDEKAEQWFKRMIDQRKETDQYFLIFNNTDDFIGEVSFHRFDRVTKIADFNIKILSEFRGNGYSQEAINLILDYYFRVFGGEIMFDDVAKDNIIGQQALLKFGFEHVPDREDVFLVKMTKEKFKSIRFDSH